MWGINMAKRKSDYFGLGYIVSLILAIIPVTSWILGAITRFSEGKIVAGLLRLVFGFNIVWIVDLVMMIVKMSIWRLLNCWYDDRIWKQNIRRQEAGSMRVCFLSLPRHCENRRRGTSFRLVQRFGKIYSNPLKRQFNYWKSINKRRIASFIFYFWIF